MQLVEAVTPFQAILAAQRREREARYAAAARTHRAERDRAILDELRRREEERQRHNDAIRAQVAKDLEKYGWAEIPCGSLRCIIEITARHFGVTPLDLTSHRRTKDVTLPRQIAMYLARTTTTRSLPEIGYQLGKRDHTTIRSGFLKIGRLLKSDETIKAHVAAIAAKVEAARPAPGLVNAAA